VARWKFDGHVSVRVEVEVDAPATFPDDPEAGDAEYEAARVLAKEEFRRRAAEALDRASAVACPGSPAWNLEELEVSGDPEPSP
jgi:hypothetical protein